MKYDSLPYKITHIQQLHKERNINSYKDYIKKIKK
jgi:hypothetical protein